MKFSILKKGLEMYFWYFLVNFIVVWFEVIVFCDFNSVGLFISVIESLCLSGYVFSDIEKVFLMYYYFE